jgi:hypothetical protein
MYTCILTIFFLINKMICSSPFMFVEEKVYNHMTKIAEQWWQMVIAEKNNTRQVISPSPRHEWMESRERDGLVVPFLGRLAPVRVTSPLFLSLPVSSPLYCTHTSRIPRPNATNHLVQSSPPPRDPAEPRHRRRAPTLIAARIWESPPALPLMVPGGGRRRF